MDGRQGHCAGSGGIEGELEKAVTGTVEAQPDHHAALVRGGRRFVLVRARADRH
ncbi:hypothetical protein OG453_41310 [Streptomyces sp. NBC_01381]|uniref:hypothetical protein n=1 Tax=Streptomyces sp. NBC_01381 TaxID=2903845 RepID=UPI00225671F9|nr:hypothetical protein [Streptomyces sp. NBC_01381]MCX4673005.1 hypothetical protein [Streptomyces sp. NBC_01381]